MSTSKTEILWSEDKQDITFFNGGAAKRIERFVERARSTLPIYNEKLPKNFKGIQAIANSQWLSREEYQGPLRDQAFRLLERKHFIQDLSSGTTGDPVLRYNSWTDELSEQLMTRRVFEMLDMGPDDRVVCLEIGAPEISAFYFRAMAELGVRDRCFLHVSTDFLSSVEPLEKIDPTVILTVPGVIARCGPRFFEMYNKNRKRSLRAVIHYAEPLSRSLRQKLLDIGVESFSFYGTTELGGAAGECKEHDGMHILDDWILPSLRNVEEVSPGRFRGEIGWTAMHYEAQPLIKYAVGDIVDIDTNPCPCGHTGVRMYFQERVHDLICVYGLKFGFKPIEKALSEALKVDDPLVQVVLTDAPKGMDMTVRVCRDHDVDEEKIIDSLYKVFEFDEMLEMGYVTVKVELVDRSYFDQRKLRRVLDKRSDTPYCTEESLEDTES